MTCCCQASRLNGAATCLHLAGILRFLCIKHSVLFLGLDRQGSVATCRISCRFASRAAVAPRIASGFRRDKGHWLRDAGNYGSPAGDACDSHHTECKRRCKTVPLRRSAILAAAV